ncbi:hypothetical protein P691DRAFT_728037 [Macrolepiota fuliginosa MF-IS2]|uniref:Transmembrane protein n=1 Tax=Macrolepiota fuliginosa MF-IS2 TaxID=1400762 RepID=A0A9P5XE81_9AGAR|nr:hypothetical protein P691DRAFT_728037 [Macrolepiota fuliginosa MF-IS2]
MHAVEDPVIQDLHPYAAQNPFTASISRSIRNSHRQDTIDSVDDIGLPSRMSGGSGPTSIPVGGASSALENSDIIRPHFQPRSPLPPRPTSSRLAPTRRNAFHTTEKPIPAPIAESRERPEQEVTLPELPSRTNGRRRLAPVQNSSSSIDRRHRQLGSLFLVSERREGKEAAYQNTFDPPVSQGMPLKECVIVFLTTIIPRQFYLHCLLRLPYLYFSRMDQIFKDADLTMEEIKEMPLRDGIAGYLQGGSRPNMPWAYLRLKQDWEDFIDNLLREWKTLNIISGLLLSGILTIFQIEGAGSDPITRYMAFWSLISALLSLLYGCLFTVRFSGMRRAHRAAEWAIEAQRDQTMFWNVWVMLAMPALWLAWSILAYIACIMSFMWRIRPNEPNAFVPPRVGPATEAGFRIFICCIFGIGVVYAILIVNTLRRYGSTMDKAWRKRIEDFKSLQEIDLSSGNGTSTSMAQSVPEVNLASKIQDALEATPSPVPAVAILEPTPPSRPSKLPPSATRSRSPSRSSLRAREPNDSRTSSQESLSPTSVLPRSRHRLSPEPDPGLLEAHRSGAAVEDEGALGLYGHKPDNPDNVLSPLTEDGLGNALDVSLGDQAPVELEPPGATMSGDKQVGLGYTSADDMERNGEPGQAGSAIRVSARRLDKSPLPFTLQPPPHTASKKNT